SRQTTNRADIAATAITACTNTIGTTRLACACDAVATLVVGRMVQPSRATNGSADPGDATRIAIASGTDRSSHGDGIRPRRESDRGTETLTRTSACCGLPIGCTGIAAGAAAALDFVANVERHGCQYPFEYATTSHFDAAAL